MREQGFTLDYAVTNKDFSISPKDPLKLLPLTSASRDTTMCLAAAHALVKLDDGQVVGDPMEQTTLKALEWDLKGRDGVIPNTGV